MDVNIPNIYNSLSGSAKRGSAVRKVASQPAWVTSPAACHHRPGQLWCTLLGGVGRSQAQNGCEVMAGADATLQSRLRHPSRWGPSSADVRAERTLSLAARFNAQQKECVSTLTARHWRRCARSITG